MPLPLASLRMAPAWLIVIGLDVASPLINWPIPGEIDVGGWLEDLLSSTGWDLVDGTPTWRFRRRGLVVRVAVVVGEHLAWLAGDVVPEPESIGPRQGSVGLGPGWRARGPPSVLAGHGRQGPDRPQGASRSFPDPLPPLALRSLGQTLAALGRETGSPVLDRRARPTGGSSNEARQSPASGNEAKRKDQR